MPTPPLTDEILQETVRVFLAKDRNQTHTADALGIDRRTLPHRLKRAAERGFFLNDNPPPAMPGYQVSRTSHITRPIVDRKTGDIIGESVTTSVSQVPEHGEVFEMPKTHYLGKITVNRDAEGRIIQDWIRAEVGKIDPLQVAEWLKDAFKDYAPAVEPTEPVDVANSNLLTVIPCNDWHLNLHTWGRQVGVSWDLKIAEPTIGDAVVSVIDRSPESEICAIVGGGDLLHINGKSNATANGTPQDTDNRYQKGVEVLGRLMVRTINAALKRHNRVIVRILKGNHDEDSSVAIVYFLAAWYRNEPRVTVDTDPSDYWWYRFGAVMLGATHGHQSRNHIAKMPGIMATRRAEDWGATKFRYVHGFHLHHSSKIATEGNGVICEVHQAPIPQDAWHFASGFLSGRSMQAITYHKDFGEIGRVRTAILDADKAA